MDIELWHWGLKRLKTKSGKNPSNFNASFAIKNLLDDHICIILQHHFSNTNISIGIFFMCKTPIFRYKPNTEPETCSRAPQNDNMRWSTFLSKLPSHGNYQHSRWKRNLTRPRSKKKEAAIIHPGEAQDWQLFALPTAKWCHAFIS